MPSAGIKDNATVVELSILTHETGQCGVLGSVCDNVTSVTTLPIVVHLE